MTIRHFLKDGRQVESVQGKVITVKEKPELYRIIRAINERGNHNAGKDGSKDMA